MVNTGMSESEWTFFVHKWERYSRHAKLSEAQKLDELWACMDADIERLAFNDGLTANTANDLLVGLKKLSVTELHPSVHFMALHQMRQARGESTKAFSARVKGTANNCNLVKKCTKASCTEQVSFLEETCYHVVLAGLQDVNLLEKVLTQAMLNNVTDLPSLITYTSAEESSTPDNRSARHLVKYVSVARNKVTLHRNVDLPGRHLSNLGLRLMR